MICHNCQHVTCPECGFRHDECPRCKANFERAARDVMDEFAPTMAKLAEGPREFGSSEEGGA